MISLNVQDGDALETSAEEAVVPGMIVRNRSRLNDAAQFVDKTADGTSGVVRILGAVGRWPTKVLATGAGEIVRAVNDSVEAYRSTVNGGEPQVTDEN